MIGCGSYMGERVLILEFYRDEAYVTPGQASLLTWVKKSDLTDIVLLITYEGEQHAK